MLLLIIHTLLAVRTLAARYDERETNWNLNTNKQAQDFLQYSGEWGPPHHYTASPGNWRFPFYSLFLDRFVNGDPANDDINGTLFESDPSSNQLRHGGDIAGLVDSLDYLQSMGIEVSKYTFDVFLEFAHAAQGIYIIGTPFLNKPYKYDQYSVCTFSDFMGLALTSISLWTLRSW
jgi:alpha-1,3-glucan synthase